MLKDYLKADFYKKPTNIVYLNEKLKDLGNLTNNIFKQFHQLLNDKDLSLKKIINDEHLESTNNDILIANIFYSIQKTNLIKLENLHNKLCPVEKILNKDPFYSIMTLETKNLYRKQLIKLWLIQSKKKQF